MPNKKESKTTRADRIRKVKAGLQKYYPATSLVLGGTTYTPSGLQAFLQKDVDANDASTAARASWLESVKLAKSTDEATVPVLDAIERVVLAQYEGTPSETAVRADFGFAKPAHRVRTAAEKSAAAAKARATRAARRAAKEATAAGSPPVAAAAPNGSAPARS